MTRLFIAAGAALLLAVCVGCDGAKSGDPKPESNTKAPAGLQPAGRAGDASSAGGAPAAGAAKSSGAVSQP